MNNFNEIAPSPDGAQKAGNTHPSDPIVGCNGRKLVQSSGSTYEPSGQDIKDCYTNPPPTLLPNNHPDSGRVVRWVRAGTRTLRKIDNEFYMTDQNELISAVLYSRLKERLDV